MKRATVRELPSQTGALVSGVPVAEQRPSEKAPTRRLPNREVFISKMARVEDRGRILQ